MSTTQQMNKSQQMNKMNPKVKEFWVKALRSGKYKQTRNVLADNKGFCCLGVLCDLYQPEYWTYRSYDESLDHLTFLNETEVLPKEVAEWAGLNGDSWDNPNVIYKNKPTYLATLNDTEKLTFNQTADIIEEQL